MLSAEAILDKGRALSALASESHVASLKTNVNTTKKLNALSTQLRHIHDHLYPVFDRSSYDLAAKLEELSPDEFIDPDGEGADALEEAEDYFETRRDELSNLRNQLTTGTVPPSHDVFEEIKRLDWLYFWKIAAMQDLRWRLLIAEGLRTTPHEGPTFKTAAEFIKDLND